jgi:hypothetical protein
MTRRSTASRARAEAYAIAAQRFSAARGNLRIFWGQVGQQNPLKTLNSDKEIQGKRGGFLGLPLGWLGWIWLDLAKFGFGLERGWPYSPSQPMPNAMRAVATVPLRTS